MLHSFECGTCFISFCLFFFLLQPVAVSQTSDSTKYFCRLSYEYFDILRTSSWRSRTIAFIRAGKYEVGLRDNGHLLLLSLSRSDEYAASSDSITDIYSSLKRTSYQFGVSWSSRYSVFLYSLNLSLPLQETYPLHPSYGAALRLDLFQSRFMPFIYYNKNNYLFHGNIGLKDFLLPIDEKVLSTEWMLGIDVIPIDSLGMTLRWTNTVFDNNPRNEGYSIVSFCMRDRYDGTIHYRNGNNILSVRGNIQDFSMTIDMFKDDVLFGDVVKSAVHLNKCFINGESLFEWGRLGCEVSAMSISGEAVGHIESWPFTILAATVFSNRMNYSMDGTGTLYSFSFFSDFSVASIHFNPVIDFYKIRTDFQIKHWEPELLIFGVKNNATEIFPIESIVCMRLDIHLKFPISLLNFGIEFEQYIPLVINRRTAVGITQGQGLDSNSTETLFDGGRRIIFSLTWN